MSSKKSSPAYLRNQPNYDFEAGQAFLDSLDAAEPESSTKPSDKKSSAGFLRTAGDIGIKLGQGSVDLGSAIVGISNLASGGLVGRGMRAIGYDPKATNEALGEYLSDAQKQADENVGKSDGFLDSIEKHIENPRAILGGVSQSAPGMFAGMGVSGALAKSIGLKAALSTTEGAAIHAAQLQAGKTSAQAAAAAMSTESGKLAASQAIKAAGTRLIGAGAATEGLQTAGKIADDAQAAGREYSDYALPALGAGAITSAVSLGSGKLFGDAATEIATGAGAGVKGGIIARGAKGFLTEGLVEEAPQSYSEQVFTNIANGEQDITKGASTAAGAGFIIGGAQGGGMAMAQGRPKVPEAGALSRAANIGIDAENAQTAQAVDLSQGAGKFTGMDSLISAVQNDDNPSLVREIAQRQVQEQINQPESIEGVPANFAELLQQSNQQREQERIETRESWESAKEQAAIDLAEQDRIEQENRLRLPAPDMPMPDGALIDDNGTLRPQTYADAAMSQAAAAQREELGQPISYGERGGIENVTVPSVPEAPTLILHPSGKPFTTKIGAQTRLKQLGGNHTIVPYEGGFAIRNNESQSVTQVQEQQAATGVPEATAGSSQSESAVIQPGDIMHPSGKPFTVKYPAIMTQRQSGGEIIKVDGGYIVRPPKQPSLEEIIAESQSEPTYEKGKTGAETARNKLDAENPFLSFLGKYGLNIDERSDVGGERGKARLIPGHGPLFRKNGLRLDELAQMAKEAGFLSQEQIDSETDNGGVNALSEMIGQALNNEVVQKVQSEPEVNLDVQMLDEATKLGLDIAGKTPDQVYDMIKAFHDQKYDAEQEQEWNTAVELFNDLSQEAQELAREYNLQELSFDIKELENAEENDTGGESQVGESVAGGAIQAEEDNRSDDETSTEQAQGVDAAESGSQEGLAPPPIASETDAEAVQDLAKTGAAKQNAPITDLGEKIGGARKDTANSFGSRSVEKAKIAEQDEPAWRRRYIAVERVIGSNTTNFASGGKWAIQDTKTNKIAYGTNFSSKEDAENAIPFYAVSQKHRVQIESRGDEPMQFGIWRQVSDSKRVKVVKENFGSREEAMQYMADHAAQIIETKTSYREELFARPEKVMRQGKERRTGDVDGNDFIKTFGFRGVEFGNWNNQAERQELLNHAYDGLMDLAEILNIPNKAISLNGDLGLAFGARGQGLTGAAAHYERGYGVINLTKMAGAGSLAHEWFHAFDHYVGRLDGKASSEKIADKNGNPMFDAKDRSSDYASYGFRYDSHSKARKELRDLYEDLIKKMFSKAEVYVEDTANAEKFVKKTRDSLADQLKKLRDNLSSQLDERYYKRKNKPASQEQLMRFDAIAESLINGENLETSYVVKEGKNRSAITTGHHTNSSLQEIGDIYRDVRGKSGHLATRDGVLDVLQGHMSRYLNRIKILKEAESGSEKTKRAPTSYRMDATEIDQGSATDYWSTPHEMAARAFSAYVEDKVSEKGGKSDFLSYGSSNGFYAMYGVRPFPAGAERTEINSAFDKLFAELKTKETDKGIALFSRESGQRSKFGFDVDELQPIVAEISSTWKNAPKINVVQTVDDLPFDTPSDVRGAYYKKQVYLVAANLRNRAEAEAVLLHETLGHAGLNGLFGNDLAPALRSIAMKNRKIAEAAAVWRKNNTDIKGKRTDDQYHLISIEEALADYAGTGRTISGVDKLFAAIQKGLRAIGLNSVADWMESATDAEVLAMLASARNHIEKGSEFSVFGERQAQVFSRQQSESEFFKEMGIETGATQNQESQYFNEVSWKAYGTDKKTGFPTWASDKLSLQSPRDVTESHDVFYAPQNKERAVKYDIHDAQGKKVGYTVIELDGDMPKQLLDIEIDKDQRGHKHAENTVAALAADAGELGIWRIVDSARSWWDRIGTRTVDEYDGTINFKDYADARASREDKSGLGKTVGKSDDPVLFSRAETNANATAIDSTIKDIAKTAIDTVSHKMADYRGLGLSTLGRRHLLDIYSDIVPQLKEYNELVQQMDADKNDAGAEADQIATKWGKLADEKKLAELMHDSTLNQIDPSKDYVPGDNRAEWSRLSLAYKSLSADAKDVFQSAAKTYNTHFMKVREAIRGRIERSELTSASKTKMLERMDADFFSTVKGVYFPLSRFGQYVVIVKNKSGETVNVSRAETLGEAEATQKQLRRDLPASEGYQVGKILKDKEFNAARDAVGRGFLKDLFGVLEQEGGVSDELQDAINQLYLSSMPDLSWAKHGIHRKGTPGFSQDARRAFAQNVFHGARYLAKLKYADRMQMSLVEMQLHVDSKATDEKYDSVKAQQVVDEMNKRHDSYMNPASNPLSTALTSFGFVFHLGLSPASALVNLSQTALVAYPVMAAKWGYSKSAAQLLTASKEAATNKNDIRAVLKGDELKAYDAAVSAGVIDVTQAHDLAGISQGEDSKVMWKIRPVMKWASFLFHHAEKFNRQVTFIAAYRLSRQTGASHEVASAEATKATYDGHFDYSAGNRPRIMQGNVAKVLFLFKQYGQNMVYTLSRQAYLAMKGQTAEERTQARKALGGLLAMHASAAGVLGLPLVNTLLAAASMLGSDDDEPWDAEIALRNMLADVFGKDASEVISKGFSRLTPWDISGRVGLDKLIFPDIQEGLEGQRLGESAMAAGLGPVAGIGINMLKGLQTMSQGQYARGLEEMMPAALRNPMKAVRYAREGAIDKSGIPIREDIGAAAIAGQALGFSPSDVQITSEGKRAIRSLDAAISHRRSELLRAHTNAVLAGDNEAKLEHRQDIAEFNKVNPTRKITQANIASSIRETKRRKEGAKDGVYLSKSRASAREAGAFAAGA